MSDPRFGTHPSEAEIGSEALGFVSAARFVSGSTMPAGSCSVASNAGSGTLASLGTTGTGSAAEGGSNTVSGRFSVPNHDAMLGFTSGIIPFSKNASASASLIFTSESPRLENNSSFIRFGSEAACRVRRSSSTCCSGRRFSFIRGTGARGLGSTPIARAASSTRLREPGSYRAVSAVAFL